MKTPLEIKPLVRDTYAQQAPGAIANSCCASDCCEGDCCDGGGCASGCCGC